MNDLIADNKEINIINSSMLIENGIIKKTEEPFYDFEIKVPNTKKIFQLNAWRFMIIQNLNGEDYFLIAVDTSWKKNL